MPFQLASAIYPLVDPILETAGFGEGFSSVLLFYVTQRNERETGKVNCESERSRGRQNLRRQKSIPTNLNFVAQSLTTIYDSCVG